MLLVKAILRPSGSPHLAKHIGENFPQLCTDKSCKARNISGNDLSIPKRQSESLPEYRSTGSIDPYAGINVQGVGRHAEQTKSTVKTNIEKISIAR
jgi:hypothetical protein